MDGLLRWLASLRGIPVEEGTELRFEFSSFPEAGLGLLTVLGLLLALAVVALAYRRDGKTLSSGQRLFLGSMRGLVVLVVFLVLFEPNLVLVTKHVRDGHSIILLDLSQSMSHRDSYRRDEVQDLVSSWEELGQGDLATKTRLDLAKSILSHDDFALIKALSEKNSVQLYGFGVGLEPMPLLARGAPEGVDVLENPPDSTGATDHGPGLPDLEQLEALGRYSNIGGAIRSALQKSRDAAIASVIVLTDGRRNLGARGAEVARFLTQRRVDQTLIVGVGDPSEAQTVTVTRVEAPDRAFQKDPFKIRASVASQGYDELSVTARLRLVSSSGEETLVQTQQVALSAGMEDVQVEFENILAEDAGSRIYRVAIDPPAGVPLVPERHSKQARVEVLAEQTRVLLLSGAPTAEYRILRQLLTRDTTVSLSCWLQSSDASFVQDGDISLEELPSERKDLEDFDVFVFMDPNSDLLQSEFCAEIARQVGESGAGMWWVCGEKYTIDALDDTASTAPLAEILPVVPNVETADLIVQLGHQFRRAYPFELTPQGRDHKAMRIVDAGRGENDVMWRQLPGWYFVFPVLEPKPAARVLAVTTADTRFRRLDGPMPIVATQYLGAGRVMFTATDDTYRWRNGFEDQYNRFWIKGIRYLHEGKLSAGSSRMRIDLSAATLGLGEPLQITATALDETFQPVILDTLTLQVARESEPPTLVELVAIDSSPGEYEATFRPARTGFFQVRPVGIDVDTTTSFEVVAAAVEKEGPVDLAELDAIAAARGGRLLAMPTDLLQAADDIPTRTRTELFRSPHSMWDSWLTVAVILILLATEWWMRKRWNLL